MADTIIYIKDAKTGQLLPIKAVNNGDGTYHFGVNTIAAQNNNKVVN